MIYIVRLVAGCRHIVIDGDLGRLQGRLRQTVRSFVGKRCRALKIVGRNEHKRSILAKFQLSVRCGDVAHEFRFQDVSVVIGVVGKHPGFRRDNQRRLGRRGIALTHGTAVTCLSCLGRAYWSRQW